MAGVTTNIDFLSRLYLPGLRLADLDTGLIERQKTSCPATRPCRATPTGATAANARDSAPRNRPPIHRRPVVALACPRRWRMNLSAARMIGFRDGECLIEAKVRYQRDQWQITLNGETTVARGKKLEDDRFAVELDDRRLIASVVAVDDKRSIFLNGATYTLLRDDPLHLVEAGGAQGGGLTAPMPGKVVALLDKWPEGRKGTQF